MRAAADGTNLKEYIEKSLDKLAEEMADTEVYMYLKKTYPDGQEALTDKEQKDFENWLKI